MVIPGFSRAPVLWFYGANGEILKDEVGIPIEFKDVTKAAGDECSCACGGDDGGSFVCEAFECGAVEMVEVGVAEEDEIDGGKIGHVKWWGRESLWPKRESWEAEADAIGKNGIGEHGERTDFQERGTMPEP